MAKIRVISAIHLQSEMAAKKYVPTIFPPSIAEPDQSLTIEEIMRNVVQTGTTGLPTGVDAVYDRDDDNDFNDPTLDPGLTVMEAMDILNDTKSKYKHSIRQVRENNWKRQQILARSRKISSVQNPSADPSADPAADPAGNSQ